MSDNIVNINGKDFKEEDLADKSRYLVAQIKDLQRQSAELNFKLHQVQASLKVMTDELIQSVEETDEQPAAAVN